MDIEKALRNYLNNKGPKVKVNDFCSVLNNNDSNAIINVIFKLVNYEIDTMDDSKCLDRVVEVLKFIEVIVNNYEGVNRKLLNRRINRLDEKLDRILREEKKKFSNLNKIRSEFNKVRRQLDSLDDLNIEKNSKKYDFMKYLINESKNMSYLEYTFMRMPSLVNIKDKDDTPLFRNLIKRYLESIDDFDEGDILYYSSLITLVQQQDSFNLPINERKKCLEEIYRFIDHLSSDKRSKRRNKDKIEYLNYIVDVIKEIDNKKQEITSIASKYNIKIHFNDDILEQARLVRKNMSGKMKNREVIDEYIISMDDDNAVEIDDALSCRKLDNGNILLGVHIASVLGYFDYNSEIVQEALSRNHSIYLSRKYQDKENDFERIIPIFPYDFSANNGSLIEGKERLARTYFFEIDKNGNVVNERFVKSIITNNKQTTYNEINNVINKGTKNKELQETVNNLLEVTRRLEKKYRPNSLYEKLKENTDDYSELRVKKDGSENIVYQSMLLTGNRVAEFFAKNNVPCLYRVHSVNEANNRKLQDMIDSLTSTYGGDQYKKLYQLIQGIYPKGWYNLEGSHSGLDLKHYCHCTSVLRRSADIIVEHALETCYDKEPTDEEITELRREIEKRKIEINSRQDPIDWFVKEYQKVKRR